MDKYKTKIKNIKQKAYIPCTPSEKLSEKKPSQEKPDKKPSDYHSAVASHLAENKGCALAYSDNSFRVVRVCPLTANLEIMEVLYIQALAPNLCVQKSSMGAIHKMAPVGVCGALLYTGGCRMHGWLRAAEKNSPWESYFLLTLLENA